MRVLIDYRSALRARSGVGEYTHELVAALLRSFPHGGSGPALDLTIFSSSWKDRLSVPSDLNGVRAIDLHIPVSLLNFSWHRLGVPSAETLTHASFDVTHSLHPLRLPSRSAAEVVTIHDLNFLKYPERTTREIRRDYGTLARQHAQRADRVIVNSQFTAGEVERELGIPRARLSVCPPGAPPWRARERVPADGYLLFVGTLEPRKNIGGLLDAYERLLARPTPVPDLVLAGTASDESQVWLNRISGPPLASRVRHLGYVDPQRRPELYAGARLLVQPSFEEGFGIPVLEAMTVGVPVVAANRGALPEVLGDAGLLVNLDRPDAADEMAAAIGRLLTEPALAATCTARGIERAAGYRWESTAQAVYDAYCQAVDHKCASA